MSKKLLLFVCATLISGWVWAQGNIPVVNQVYHMDGDLREATGLFTGGGRGISYESDGRGNPLSAARLDGTRSRITLKPMSVTNSTNLSISCMLLSLEENQHSPFIYVGISASSGFGLAIKRAGLQIPGNNPVFLTGGVYETTDTSIHIHANKWHHFALVKEATQYSIYLDGTLIMQRTQFLNATTDSIRIGADQQHLIRWGLSLNALMDEVKVFDSALTPSEIATLVASDTAGGNHSNLGTLKGRVFWDGNRNCTPDVGESGLRGGHVQISPGNFVTPLDTNGNYSAYVSTGVTYSASFLDRAFIRVDSVCSGSVTLAHPGDAATLNLGIQGAACAKLNVNLSASRRRRCFGNNTTVTVSNEGLAPSNASRLKLTYPDGIFMTSPGTTAFTTVAPGVFETAIPALAVGRRYQFTVIDSVACRDSLRNHILCQKAAIVHPTPCVTPGQNWDGAIVQASTRCVLGQSTVFVIRNLGRSMADSVSYRFYANDGLASRGKLKLAAGDSLVFSVADIFQTWILEVEQTPGCDLPTATVLAWPCMLTSPPPTNELVIRATLPDSGYAYAEECLMVRDSYDPNDKEVSPKGFGPNNILEPGTRLTYKINFQNEGNAPTEFVSIADTLSSDLDLTTFERGTESHDGAVLLRYYTSTGKPVIRYRWSRLNLVPKSQSERASQGFVTFSIRPKANLPEGTRVSNVAGIYFDYNPVVMTPAANITYGRVPAPTQPVTPPTVTAVQPMAKVFTLSPNPASGMVTLTGLSTGTVRILILDATGKEVTAHALPSDGVAQVSVHGLNPGFYIVQIQSAQGTQSCRLVKQ